MTLKIGERPHMVSYAQNREDVLLARALTAVERGFYIDIGANHPVSDSVTKHFYEKGWNGLNIEPGPIFDVLQNERTRDVNLQIGLSDVSGTDTLYEFPGGLATFSEQEAEARKTEGYKAITREVPVRTLADVCEEYVTDEIHFIKIDVEGYESKVIAGADWLRWRPRIVLVESTKPTTMVPTHEAWEYILLDAGYIYANFDGLNRYYVRQEDEQLVRELSIPANIFDNYTLYNFVLQDESYRDFRRFGRTALFSARAVQWIVTRIKRYCVRGISNKNSNS